jgi:hypothetical protein
MSSGMVPSPKFQKMAGPVALALIQSAIWVTK